MIPRTSRINGLPHGAFRVGVFGGCVEERTAPVVPCDDGLADAAQDRRDHFAWRLLRERCDGFPPELVLLFDIGEDEIVLRREMIVERRLGHARFRDDAVDAHATDALGVEETGRGIE